MVFLFFWLRNKELGENRTLIPPHSSEWWLKEPSFHTEQWHTNSSLRNSTFFCPLSPFCSLSESCYTTHHWQAVQPQICLADHLLGRNQGAGSTAPSPLQPLTACQLILLAFSQDKKVPWEDRLVCLTFKRVWSCLFPLFFSALTVSFNADLGRYFWKEYGCSAFVSVEILALISVKISADHIKTIYLMDIEWRQQIILQRSFLHLLLLPRASIVTRVYLLEGDRRTVTHRLPLQLPSSPIHADAFAEANGVGLSHAPLHMIIRTDVPDSHLLWLFLSENLWRVLWSYILTSKIWYHFWVEKQVWCNRFLTKLSWWTHCRDQWNSYTEFKNNSGSQLEVNMDNSWVKNTIAGIVC